MKNSVRHGAQGPQASDVPPGPTEHRAAPERVRVLRALARRGRAGVDELTSDLGGHPNTVRKHLDRLLADGEVERSSAGTHARGRPAYAFEVTRRGMAALADPADDPAAGGLLPALVDHLLTRPDGEAQARSIGVAWGRRLGDGSGSRERLRDLFTRQGFGPRREDPDLVLTTCPILAQAREHPEVVCRVHQGLLEGAGGEAVLEPFSEPDGCRVRWVRPG